MIRRLSVVSILVVLGVITSTLKANAQTADVNFNGTVPSSCTITKTNDGVLSPITSTSMDANSNRGQVLLTCAGSGAVTISNPIPTTLAATNYVALSGTQTVAELWNASIGGTYLADSQGMFGSTSYTAVSNNAGVPLYVNMFTRGATLPAGSYGFKTTVTVNPL